MLVGMLPSVMSFLRLSQGLTYILLLPVLSVNEHWTENEISMFLKILSQQWALLAKDNLSISNGYILQWTSTTVWYLLLNT